MKRFLTLCAIVIAGALGGCKDLPADTGSPSAYIHPGADVVIKSVRTYVPQDTAGSTDEYYIVTFTFTNSQTTPLTPRMDHFVIEDQDHVVYLGAETGNAALIGISNYRDQLKPGDSHDYTLGFRVPQNTYGTLFYDPTL